MGKHLGGSSETILQPAGSIWLNKRITILGHHLRLVEIATMVLYSCEASLIKGFRRSSPHPASLNVH